ncbi:MAG: AAA family ATPase [Acidobacteriota bacterium]|nr:AAA family ATPase [Acidobacteriota bacterium]
MRRDPSPRGSVIAAAINPLLQTQLDEKRVEAMIDERLKAIGTQRVEIVLPTSDTRNMGRQHTMFPLLVKFLGLRLNVYLKGPAGSGKTTAVEKAAEALGLPFYCQSMGPQTSPANLLGYMDANGHYVPGLLFKPFTEGGVVGIDEIDNSNPGVLTVLNSALANGYCSFPCGMMPKHKDFIVVACGNTFGKGADSLYVGRVQLDAATLDRFVGLDWDYDEPFELEMVGEDQHWTLYVQRLRAAAMRLKMRVILSPRASVAGAKALRAGIDRATVEQAVLWSGVATDDRQKILANV